MRMVDWGNKIQFIIMFLGGALSLLLITAFSISDLTTANCPDNYNLLLANTTDSSFSQSSLDLIYGRIYSASDQIALRQAFSSADTAKLNSYLLSTQLLLPFILIAIAFAFAYLIALSCCVFEKSCPPCPSWKRDFTTKPYRKVELKCTTAFTVGFALAISITTVMGFVFYPALEENAKMTKCSLYYSLDVANNGDSSSNWGGFSQLAAQVSNISSQLSTVGAAITSNFGASNTLPATLAALRQQNLNIYNANRLSTVCSPNSSATNASLLAGSPLPTLTPLFIATGLGPLTINNTMTGDIQGGITVTENATTQAYKVFSSSQVLFNSISNIQGRFNASLQSMNLDSRYLGTTSSSISSFSARVIDGFFSELLYFVQGVLGFIIVGSLVILVGVLGTYYFEMLGCRTCVSLGWVLYGLLYFGVVGLSFVLLAVGGVSYSFCQFYGGIISNQTQLVSYSSNPSSFSRVFQALNPCFYGNGTISQSYSMAAETATLSDLYSQIGTFTSMMDSSKATYVDLNHSTSKIEGWINAMEMYRAGIYVDADPTVLTEDNPYVALGNLNRFSNNASAGPYPTCTFDYWVFDSANCSHNSTEAIYSSSPTSGTSFVSTAFMCLSLNEKFSSSSNNIWSPSDITNRYVSRRQCQNSTLAFDALLLSATALINYRDSRINLYQTLKDQLTSLLLSNQALNNALSTFTASVLAFTASTASLNSLMTSSINGLSYSSNCTVVANALRMVYNSYCVNFVFKAVQLAICCLLLLAFMVGGMLSGSIFAIRYGRIEKDPKAYLSEPITIQEELSSAKREDSSDTSSSEDE